MYNGKFSRSRKGLGSVMVVLLLAACLGIGGTVAYILTQSGQVTNTFAPGKVDAVVEEVYDGADKTSIQVKNQDGTTDAFLRVKLVTYRVNDAGNHIGGTATLPVFALNTDWFEKDGFYYYTKAVAPGDVTSNLIAEGSKITLKEYTDTDGGKQVIEVMAEAIQARGADENGDAPAKLAWGVEVVGGQLAKEAKK